MLSVALKDTASGIEHHTEQGDPIFFSKVPHRQVADLRG